MSQLEDSNYEKRLKSSWFYEYSIPILVGLYLFHRILTNWVSLEIAWFIFAGLILNYCCFLLPQPTELELSLWKQTFRFFKINGTFILFTIISSVVVDYFGDFANPFIENLSINIKVTTSIVIILGVLGFYVYSVERTPKSEHNH